MHLFEMLVLIYGVISVAIGFPICVFGTATPLRNVPKIAVILPVLLFAIGRDLGRPLKEQYRAVRGSTPKMTGEDYLRKAQLAADMTDFAVNGVLYNRDSFPTQWWRTDRTIDIGWLRQQYAGGIYPRIEDEPKEGEPKPVQDETGEGQVLRPGDQHYYPGYGLFVADKVVSVARVQEILRDSRIIAGPRPFSLLDLGRLIAGDDPEQVKQRWREQYNSGEVAVLSDGEPEYSPLSNPGPLLSVNRERGLQGFEPVPSRQGNYPIESGPDPAALVRAWADGGRPARDEFVQKWKAEHDSPGPGFYDNIERAAQSLFAAPGISLVSAPPDKETLIREHAHRLYTSGLISHAKYAEVLQATVDVRVVPLPEHRSRTRQDTPPLPQEK